MARQNRIAFHQALLPFDQKQHAAGAVELSNNELPDSLAQGFVAHQRSVKLRNRQIGLRHGQFDIADEIGKHGELRHHLFQALLMSFR